MKVKWDKTVCTYIGFSARSYRTPGIQGGCGCVED